MQKAVFICEQGCRQLIDDAVLEAKGFVNAGTIEPDADQFAGLGEQDADMIVVITRVLPIEMLKEIAATGMRLRKPIVVYTESDNSAVISYAIEIGISAFVVDRFDSERFPSIATAAASRYTLFEALSSELDKTKQTLRDRKVIERAKGLIMKLRGVDETEAYRQLQKKAMEKNRKLVEIAQQIIDAQEYLFD